MTRLHRWIADVFVHVFSLSVPSYLYFFMGNGCGYYYQEKPASIYRVLKPSRNLFLIVFYVRSYFLFSC